MEALLAQDAARAAPMVLGMHMVCDSPQGRTSGRIVEVEAYNQTDPASHSYRPVSKRTQPMFGPPGTIYIYFIYGIHYCINIVTGMVGEGQALLVRALEPLEGIPLMQQRRGTDKLTNLCSGPAKLVQAMGILPDLSGGNFFTGPLRLEMGQRVAVDNIITGPRIGISKAIEKPWRFYIKDNKFVS